ncbi:MAG: ABC transporter permease, partial [Eubacterium sp.]|nr:ABC transporter permease [Eubacterium sp.]
MNIVNKLTLRHLKENKGRTIITTLGICVSVAMITAVFVSIASFMKFYGDATIFEAGNKHVEYYALSNEQVSALKADDRIDEIGLYTDLPEESDGFRVDSDSSSSIRVGNIYAGDETNLKQMLTSKMDGELPKNEHEIAVEQSLLEKNKLDWKIGETVTIQLGERYYEYDFEDENGEFVKIKEHLKGSTGTSSEEFAPAYEAQFKIVGILYNNNPTRRNGKIIRGLSSDEKKSAANATVTLKNPNYKSLDVIEDISETIGVKYGSEQMYINKDYLQSKLAIDGESILATSIIPMGIVILVIIMIASVVLIYNSFGMSLSERTRYLGMLGSVGATKRQKKKSVYFEGAVLGLVGIPLGIIGGVIGIGVTLEIVGKKIIETGMLFGVEDSAVEFKAVVPLWAVVGVVVFSLITIFISAVIPAKKASSITPVEALRQSTEIKLKAKKVKSPKYIRKIFGYEGELAHKNLKRNGRKSRVITASIAISVILFLSVNYFCDMFTRVNN